MYIDKFLTLSTAHIKKDTAKALDKECNWENGGMGLCAYKKRSFGWWISIPDEADLEDLSETVPQDLMECLRLANAYGCSLLCLDRDGEIVPELGAYDW